MRRAGRPERGITLLELLIAVTLVSLLAVGMLFAMNVGFGALEKANGHLMSNRRVLGAQRVLERQISGLIPVMARCGLAKQLYFQGGPSGMRFVSSYSLEEAARGYARILDYAVIAGENGRGVRLVVTESPYTGPGSTGGVCSPVPGGVPERPAGRPFVLADRLASCRLSYMGGGGEWSERFAGNRPPAAIRVEMVPLDADPARLRMGSLVVGVRATRDPNRTYTDVDQEYQYIY